MAGDERLPDRQRRERPHATIAPQRSRGRVPPHNLQAEESVLGAMLLSRDAIGAVGEPGLRSDDFYKPGPPAHLRRRSARCTRVGQPVDAVTVADELRRAGLLDEVGGVEALHELQNATPAISNAAPLRPDRPGHALLRRLIGVAGEIAEIAYGEPDDVTKALDEAESKVFEVAERPGHRLDPADSASCSSEAIDRLEETYERGDTITGVGHRLPRPRRAAVGPAAEHAEHRRRPPGDGQDRVRPRAWRPTSPSTAGSRCSCSRSRWATSS